ncbi:hypothetical protein O181_045822 [Austropuccinia psidii MF-1]|uniref:Uncharacterized protein n=1 Tax=Austropuccinia psidii MF-1 TaxID=1389203 RepID=A0A9Q3DQ37_9BASI|nr:hypothetical protein [Austropuccinia psidii MF-1]
MIFPDPTGSIILKVEFVVMNDSTSQQFILGNDYLNIYGIGINNHQDREAFASDNEPLGAIKGHKVEIMLNVERPYPPLLGRPAYPACPRAREALESHINELMKLGVLRKGGHNEEVEVNTPVIITWHNDKSRMVGDFRALNT